MPTLDIDQNISIEGEYCSTLTAVSLLAQLASRGRAVWPNRLATNQPFGTPVGEKFRTSFPVAAVG